MGMPKPITEFAPLTARVLADRFEIARILSPTAIVLEPRARIAQRATVVDIAGSFDRISTRARGGRVRATSWIVYPVVTTVLERKDRATCFTYPHRVSTGEILSARPMFKHEAWTRRHWRTAARRARFEIAALRDGSAEELYAADRTAGPPGAPVEVSLERYAGSLVELRFCARRLRGIGGKATVGWADPRILRSGPDS
jgi:hypothetical protein